MDEVRGEVLPQPIHVETLPRLEPSPGQLAAAEAHHHLQEGPGDVLGGRFRWVQRLSIHPTVQTDASSTLAFRELATAWPLPADFHHPA